MAYTFTRTGAQIEEIHNTVEDPKSNAQFSDDIRTIAGEYRGLWPDTGGSANKGDTYQTQSGGVPTGQYFTALQNTTVDPVGDDVNWRLINSAAMMDRGVVAVDSIADLLALPEGQRKEGLRYLVKGYHAGRATGGGDFYWDAASEEADNSGTVFEVEGVTTGRWIRARNSDRATLDATWFGAIPDYDPALASGTDNSPAQLLADDYAHEVGANVEYPPGNYRFTQPLARKATHVGADKAHSYLDRRCTFYLDNDTPQTWLTSRGHGGSPWRSRDIEYIDFISVQNRIHKLFDANMYRGFIRNVYINGFDVGFDIDGVYVNLINVHCHNNNIGIYPRPLRFSPNKPSTMFNFDGVICMGNDIGFLYEHRLLGGTAPNDNDLLSLSMNNCGFEQNASHGFKITQRIWYFTTQNCWSESNGVGYEITGPGTDWTDIASRWDDDVLIESPVARLASISSGLIRKDRARNKFRSGVYVNQLMTGTVELNSAGEVISMSDMPLTVGILPDNTVRLTHDATGGVGYLELPHINVTPMTRGTHLSYSVAFDNTIDAGRVNAAGRITQINVRCFDPSDPSVSVLPAWTLITVGWTSGTNMPY